jgi:hypothetical protein
MKDNRELLFVDVTNSPCRKDMTAQVYAIFPKDRYTIVTQRTHEKTTRFYVRVRVNITTNIATKLDSMTYLKVDSVTYVLKPHHRSYGEQPNFMGTGLALHSVLRFTP